MRKKTLGPWILFARQGWTQTISCGVKPYFKRRSVQSDTASEPGRKRNRASTVGQGRPWKAT
eukprot:463139-Pyramimonas_sp.AAC.1